MCLCGRNSKWFQAEFETCPFWKVPGHAAVLIKIPLNALKKKIFFSRTQNTHVSAFFSCCTPWLVQGFLSCITKNATCTCPERCQTAESPFHSPPLICANPMLFLPKYKLWHHHLSPLEDCSSCSSHALSNRLLNCSSIQSTNVYWFPSTCQAPC